MSIFGDQIGNFIEKELSPKALGNRVAQVAVNAFETLDKAGSSSPEFDAEIDGQQGLGSLIGVRQSVFVHYSYVAQAVASTLLELMALYIGSGIGAAVIGAGGFVTRGGQTALISQALWGDDPQAEEISDWGDKLGFAIGTTASSVGGNPAGVAGLFLAGEIGGALGSLAGSVFGHQVRVMVDGAEVTPADFFENKQEHKNALEIIVGSIVPYDRRIDVQTGSGGKPIRFTTAAPQLYEQAAAAVQQQFDGLFDVTHIDDWDYADKYKPQHQFNFVTPAIRITRLAT